MKVQENQMRVKLNGTHQLLDYADDVNLMGDNMITVKKNTGTLIAASKKVGLEIKAEKTMRWPLVTRMQGKFMT
jgi:hypothetical protein